MGFMVLGWTVKASEILIECNVDRVEKYSREYVYRIDDKYFGLRQSFKSLSSDGKTFENFCSEQHIDHLFAGVKLDLRKIKWTRNFQTTFYETGARCTFLAGIQHKYFFVSEIYVDVNAVERQRSFRSVQLNMKRVLRRASRYTRLEGMAHVKFFIGLHKHQPCPYNNSDAFLSPRIFKDAQIPINNLLSLMNAFTPSIIVFPGGHFSTPLHRHSPPR